MINALWVFLGCGLGGVLRYGTVALSALLFGVRFPYGIMLVNVIGSLVMGSVFARFEGSEVMKSLLLVGLLGGYTTFSSFSIDTLKLIESGQGLAAIANIVLSVGLCLLAVWLGYSLSKHVF